MTLGTNSRIPPYLLHEVGKINFYILNNELGGFNRRNLRLYLLTSISKKLKMKKQPIRLLFQSILINTTRPFVIGDIDVRNHFVRIDFDCDYFFIDFE